jgi:predicted nucleic acid-binding protein
VKWLLDTNVLSETVKPKPDTNVVSWIGGQTPVLLAISAVTFAELREGVQSDENEPRRRYLAKWIEATAELFRETTIPLDDAILIDWLRISRQLNRQRIARQAPDLLLAATARVHALTLVTRNIRDFANTGITVYNPWTDETQTMEAP